MFLRPAAVSTFNRSHLSLYAPLVRRFGSPHGLCGTRGLRTTEPKPHQKNDCLVSFDSKVRSEFANMLYELRNRDTRQFFKLR